MLISSDKSVLFVEDSSTMRRILQNALKRSGYANVTGAENGVEALAKCKEKHFDCVLTDWNMPEMTGMDMVRQLRQDPDYAKTPMMMITTEAYREDVIIALTQGIDNYIIKPFTLELFSKKMDQLLGE